LPFSKMDATRWRLWPRPQSGVAASRMIAALAAICLASIISGTIFSDEAPSCAPSRGAGLTYRTRPRPLWLANALEAAGITATTRPNWPWTKERPTEAFSTARYFGEKSVFTFLASLSTHGALAMDRASVCRLVALQVTMAVALLAIVSTWTVEDSFTGFIALLAMITVGMVIEGALAAVPLIFVCGRAGFWLLGCIGVRHQEHAPTELQCLSAYKVTAVSTHPGEPTSDTDEGNSSSSDDEDHMSSSFEAAQASYWSMMEAPCGELKQ